MYQRIDKGDGSIQDLTREQLAERLAKFLSLVDEEIGRIDAGHVVADDFAWYQRKFVPGLRGTPSQQDQQETAAAPGETYVVVYGGHFYEISEGGMEALAEYGAACLVIGKLRDEAVKSPRLLEEQSRHESVTFERLKLAITAWLLRNQFLTDDIRFFTRSEWTLRRETVGRNSVLAMTFEGSVLYHILNDTFSDHAMSARLEDEFRRMLAEQGHYYELGYAWCLSLYLLD
jgi:hypothetical protein